MDALSKRLDNVEAEIFQLEREFDAHYTKTRRYRIAGLRLIWHVPLAIIVFLTLPSIITLPLLLADAWIVYRRKRYDQWRVQHPIYDPRWGADGEFTWVARSSVDTETNPASRSTASLARLGQNGTEAINVAPLPVRAYCSPRAQVEALKGLLAAELERQRATGVTHAADPYWTDDRTGHNIGEDELQAVRFMEAIDPTATGQDAEEPALYAARLLRNLRVSSSRFRAIEPDPDGYGIGTFREVIAAFERQCDEFHIDLTSAAKPHLPDDAWYELERRLQDAKAHVRSLIALDKLGLLLDQVQVLIFLTLIRLRRESNRLSDADTAYYTKELYDLRSFALLGIAGVPKIYLGLFYRYIAGLSNAVSMVRTRTAETQTESVDRLPFTCFDFDAEAGQRAIDEQGAGSSFYTMTADTPHAYVLIGLSYLDSVTTPAEKSFLDRVFRDPAETLLTSKETVLYHYLECHFVDDDGHLKPDGGAVFCLAVRRGHDGMLDVLGWNCGSTSAIYGEIHQLALMANFNAGVPKGTDMEADDLLHCLSQLLRPTPDLEPEVDETAVIIAEGPIGLFPFAALQLRYGAELSERAAIVTRLNATKAGADCWHAQSFASGIVISVSDEPRNSGLAALPHATEEGEAVARLWKCNRLRDQAADPKTIASMIQRHELVHIATHGIVEGTLKHLDRTLATTDPVTFLEDAEAAMDATALLAGGRDADGARSVLSGKDLRQLDLSGARLIFLSLCGGATARSVGREAALGLAQNLIRAGAHLVVATIYPVADAVALEFAMRFHERLVEGTPPAEALRQTQRFMRDEGYGWHSWAGYQIIA